jgi:hypothetical protein
MLGNNHSVNNSAIPPGFDPLIDLPEGIADWPVVEQLTAVAGAYGPEVRYGRCGLPLIINDNPQSVDDWRDYERAWRQLQVGGAGLSAEQLRRHAEQALILYQARELQITWALQALDFEPQEVLAYLVNSQREGQSFIPEVSGPLSWELFQRHGPCPKNFDPSRQGELEELRNADQQQRLTALQQLYATVLSQVQAWQRGSNTSQQSWRRAVELEGQFFWTAEYLNLDPGWALTQLSISSASE